MSEFPALLLTGQEEKVGCTVKKGRKGGWKDGRRERKQEQRTEENRKVFGEERRKG